MQFGLPESIYFKFYVGIIIYKLFVLIKCLLETYMKYSLMGIKKILCGKI